jgi:Ran GTPase-activating protein (RanGAP) involved in mRNA processing and transport
MELDLSDNSLGDAGTAWLVAVLALPGVARSLRELHLNQNFITPEGAAVLGAALEALRGLRTLRASANPIGPRGCEAIVAGLAEGGALANLTLNDCG